MILRTDASSRASRSPGCVFSHTLTHCAAAENGLAERPHGRQAAPTDYILQYANGKLRRQGPGLSFFYFAPSASIVSVPLASVNVPFVFNEPTSDFQTLTVQGQLTYRISDPKQAAAMLDFTLDARGKYVSDQYQKLPERLVYSLQTLVRAEIQTLPLRDALVHGDAMTADVLARLKTSAEVLQLGIEILNLAFLSLKPAPEMAKALEAEAREALNRRADEAVYTRRNAAIEQERRIRENELQTELAVQEKQRELHERELSAQIALEQQRGALTDQKVENERKEADSRAYSLQAVLVTRKTRLEELIERFNTRAQARFYIEHAGGDFSAYVSEHDAYQRSLEIVRRAIEAGLKIQIMDRSLVPTYLFSKQDIIVTLGQDGLVANTAKYVAGQPILAVNPDSDRFDGILLPFQPASLRPNLERALAGHAPIRSITLAEALLRDGQRLLAFNDLFIGAASHISARYRITHGARSEPQSSSGVIVSTGAGSTGWLSSVFNQTSGILSYPGGARVEPIRLAWEEQKLIYVVREPFLSRHSKAGIVAGVIEPNQVLTLESQMPAAGVIFSDGVEADHLDFNSGAIATIGIAPERANLVIP